MSASAFGSIASSSTSARIRESSAGASPTSSPPSLIHCRAIRRPRSSSVSPSGASSSSPTAVTSSAFIAAATFAAASSTRRSASDFPDASATGVSASPSTSSTASTSSVFAFVFAARRSSARRARFSSRSASSLLLAVLDTSDFAVAVSRVKRSFSAMRRFRSSGARATISRFSARPPRAAFTFARRVSRREAPIATHRFAHVVAPSRSSLPSQQSQTPSLTRDEGTCSD